MDLLDIVRIGTEKIASDIHVTVGRPITLRINGELVSIDDYVLTPEDTRKMVREALSDSLWAQLEENGEIDSSYSLPGVGRYRINAFKQRGSYGMVLRIIPLVIPSMEALGLPKVVEELARLRRGMVLVTGPTGSGKSTTLATMVNQINHERNCHVLTLEDPIEYLHKHQEALVTQREVGSDTGSFANALRAALRQDPDVILVGEMRDLETISIALTAAETGHLVFSTLHTSGAAKTIDRIIDVFPPHQQHQVRVQLSSVIQGIISQQLLPKADGVGRVAAFEVMIATPAIRNLIREDKIHQIDTSIQTGASHKMQTMDNSLIELYRRGDITREVLMTNCIDLQYVKKIVM
ncbi:MAG: type IV pilus twitching motility protein PilT [Tissierellia bacterium]|jgi:twitching motility protein PilT|nr:type IV pilus twitching motility protein PilT [Tissierellia bacterium]